MKTNKKNQVTRDAKLSIDSYSNNPRVEEIVNNIFLAVDQKNADGRPCYVDKKIPKALEEFEKKFNVEGFEKGVDPIKVIDFLKEFANLQAETDMSFNPKYYIAHMLKGTLSEPGFAGALQGMIMHGNAAAKEVSVFANAIEKETGNMIKEILGYKRNTPDYNRSASFIVSGGSEANIMAMNVARNAVYIRDEQYNIQKEGVVGLYNKTNLTIEKFQKQLNERQKNNTEGKLKKISLEEILNIRMPSIAVPRSAHYGFKRIADKLGIGTDNITWIDVDENQRMKIDDLKKKLDESKSKNKKIFAVVGMMGTTETGSVDDLKAIHKVVSQYSRDSGDSVWLHADGAYGALATLTDKYAHLKEILPYYDSVTFDPHKLLGVPYNAGSITFRNARLLKSVSTDAPYLGNGDLEKIADEEFIRNIYSHLAGVKLSCSLSTAGMLSTYLTLKVTGHENIKKDLEKTFETAKYLAKKLTSLKDSTRRIDLSCNEIDTNVVCFTYHPYHTEISDSKDQKRIINEVNKKAYEEIAHSKDFKFMLSSTTLQDEFLESTQYFRAVITNPSTTHKDIDEFVEEFGKLLDKETYPKGYRFDECCD